MYTVSEDKQAKMLFEYIHINYCIKTDIHK
jgi:hypothetical protein